MQESYLYSNMNFIFLLIPGLFIGLLYYLFSSYPKTQDELIDYLLKNYEPINKEAFIELQESAIKIGKLNHEYQRKYSKF